MKKILWLDCDPGHDDAMAILLACFHPDLEVLGISTVAGNQSLEKTTRNAANILNALGRNEIPLFAGMARPILGTFPFCEEIHGKSGLDNLEGNPVFPQVELPQTAFSQKLEAVYGLIKVAFMHRNQKINFVATGSLTNLAMLLLLFPDFSSMIEITLMGGALGIGNTHPVAEFNIENDPEAAKIVFESGVPLTMVPLEVTHTVLVRPEVEEKIGSHSPFRKQILDLLSFFKESYQKVFYFQFPPLHDPVAVFYLIDPSCFESRLMRVDIETSFTLGRGQTVCDFYNRSPKNPNCNVALKVDEMAFWKTMLRAIDDADRFLTK
jgi:inosine-uridine nucleoside N-ribohydrolase